MEATKESLVISSPVGFVVRVSGKVCGLDVAQLGIKLLIFTFSIFFYTFIFGHGFGWCPAGFQRLQRPIGQLAKCCCGDRRCSPAKFVEPGDAAALKHVFSLLHHVFVFIWLLYYLGRWDDLWRMGRFYFICGVHLENKYSWIPLPAVR